MINVRPFHHTDRAIVRQICCDSADRGEVIENIFPDREIAGDLLTAYYTDYEPQSCFVAEKDGLVVGYVLGCLDNRRYGLALLFLIVPKVIFKGIIRGTFVSREFWQIVSGMARNWRRLFSWRKKSFHSHQGHLHIGVAKAARRQKVGRALVEALLTYAKAHEAGEVMASVHEGNKDACRFFEQLGFVTAERHPMVMQVKGVLQEYHSISYVKKIR